MGKGPHFKPNPATLAENCTLAFQQARGLRCNSSFKWLKLMRGEGRADRKCQLNWELSLLSKNSTSCQACLTTEFKGKSQRPVGVYLSKAK